MTYSEGVLEKLGKVLGFLDERSILDLSSQHVVEALVILNISIFTTSVFLTQSALIRMASHFAGR